MTCGLTSVTTLECDNETGCPCSGQQSHCLAAKETLTRLEEAAGNAKGIVSFDAVICAVGALAH